MPLPHFSFKLILALGFIGLMLAGCATLDERQRAWIFQPGDRSWGNTAQAAADMDEVWIDFASEGTGTSAKLHGLWLAQPNFEAQPKTPVVLYLHGARYNVQGSAFRMRRLHDLGFSVLSIDYRGFGKSTQVLPSETLAVEDARAAWAWLAARYPTRPRYIYGHSLGGAIAIDLASQVADESGTLVEGTFSSIPDVASSLRFGWLPIGPLITQRFESAAKVARIGSPLLVLHGSEDNTIKPELGRKLFDAAQEPKAFVLVQGGSHYNASALGKAQLRQAMSQLFNL
jgi:uncharacterized protein